MLPLSSTSDLFTSLGRTAEVLSFFDYYLQSMNLMKSLSKASREYFLENQEAFENALSSTKQYLKVLNFNSKASEILLSHSLYKYVELDINIYEQESLDSFIDFLAACKNINSIKFRVSFVNRNLFSEEMK